MQKLVEHIVRRLENEPPRVPDTLGLAHSRETVLGIWFYSPVSRTLSYSTTVKSHSEKSKFPNYDDTKWWLRGRVFKYNDLNYLLAYTDNKYEPDITDAQLQDLINKIEATAKIKIDYAVDSQGYEIG